jgi:membrane fusion protein (multidrug efflux system)
VPHARCRCRAACFLFASLAALLLAACSKAPENAKAPAAAPGAAPSAPAQAAAPPPPKVDVMQVIQRDATITGELVGAVSAVREVPLRSQVTGTVQKILFDAGQRVRANQLLFTIDPRPYQATLEQAQAAVADAQASLARTRQDVARYEPLLPYNAIPRATYDAAVAAEKSAQAMLDQRRAAVERARLDVRYTEVRSPVDGQIGAQQVEVGGLAVASTTVLATVTTVDPMYVTFSVPEADYVRYMKAHGAGAARQAQAATFHLILPDGSEYRHPGRFDFVQPAVSGATGTLALRTRFPNPDGLLRPGMNVRVRLTLAEVPNALLVPQRAVTELLDRSFVTVVGAGDKAEQRPVTLGDRVGNLVIVSAGLAPGERVVVEGVQKAAPGTTVDATPITEAQLEVPATARTGAAAGAKNAPGSGPPAAPK